MILAPSEIHFLKDTSNGLLSPDPGTMADLSHRFQIGQERIPKVQVASKDGFWFALNNSYLHILRDLQKHGKCAQVCVEVVPLTKVPASVQEGMVVGKEDYSIWADGMTRQGTSTRVPSNYCLEVNQGAPASFQEEKAQSEPSYAANTCQGYQKNEVDMYGISEGCLANTALLDALDSETDASSYSSTDYSDYYEDDDDDDVCDTDSDYEDDLRCNVCERVFASTRLLSIHQQQKRHFGCSVCKENFSSHPALQNHKNDMEHWSQEEDNGSDDYEAKKKSKGETEEDDDDANGDQEPDELKSLL